MDENLQRDNSEQNKSYFLKRKWWRPLYYVYFVAVFAGLVLIYSARHRATKKPVLNQAASIQRSKTNSSPSQLAESSQASKISSAPSEKEETSTPQMVGNKTSTPTPAGANQFAYMMSPPSQVVAKGKSLFMDDCVACHGANGEGDGPAAAALKPKPRDFHSAKGWINGRMASGMFKTLTQGIPGSPMPPFNSISVKDRLAIICYIRSFKGFPKETKSDIVLLGKMVHESGGSD